MLRQVKGKKGLRTVAATHAELGQRWLYIEGDVPLLFTDNETNNKKILGTANAGPFVKDGINDYLVQGHRNAVNPQGVGTKVAAHHTLQIKAGGTAVLRLRLVDTAPGKLKDPFSDFDGVFISTPRRSGRLLSFDHAAFRDGGSRHGSRDRPWPACYGPSSIFCSMWDKWLKDNGGDPFSVLTGPVRNREWGHMVNDDIISMPDKWEYPWYAAWDLAFHTIPLAAVDIDFAKEQLDLMLRQTYLHPNGQIPAYEWNFSDVNPPVHAWATLAIYRMEQAARGEGDLAFSQTLVRQASGQLHLVGEPQGPVREQRFRGRLSRSRQHRGLRSIRAVADRRTSRAGRRYRLDGAL